MITFFSVDEEELLLGQEKPTSPKSSYHVAQTLFPSTLCSAFLEVIALLDDQAVSLDGTAVYEVAYQVSYDHKAKVKKSSGRRSSIFWGFLSFLFPNNIWDFLLGDLVLSRRGQQLVPQVLHGKVDQGLPRVHVSSAESAHPIHPKVAPTGGLRPLQLHHRLHHVLREAP